MCLICIAWRRHPRHRLVVAANRDEYHARPAAAAHWWDDAPGVLAGRDLEAGGTWLGITRTGRFAAITNYRESAVRRAGAPSRGALVSAFLTGNESAPDYLGRIADEGHRYNGFSLLAMDGETLAFASNRGRGVTRLEPGVFGLSNHLLDTPWPKITAGKADLERLVAAPEIRAPDLLAFLAPRAPANAGSNLAGEWRRSARFIPGQVYGTRTSTVVLLDADAAGSFVERNFDARGAAAGDAAFELRAGPGGGEPSLQPGTGIG